MQNVAFPSQVIPSLLVAITCNSFETELGLWQKVSEQEQGKKTPDENTLATADESLA